MSIEKDLKKEGIQIIKPLDTLKVNLIASKVANTLIDCLPNQSLDYQTLFIKLSRCNMYIAKLSHKCYNNAVCPRGTTDGQALHQIAAP